MGLYEKSKLRDAFLELTSDKVIREAAYPEEEWAKNGGGEADYHLVLTQDNPQMPSKPIGLLGGRSSKTVAQCMDARYKNIKAHWQNVATHNYYRELDKNQLFRNAFKIFKEKSELVDTSELLKSEFYNFRFCNLIAQHIGWQVNCDEVGYMPACLDAKDLTKAKGHIEKLQEDIQKGLNLNNYIAQISLKEHLKQLIIEINQAPRKERETPTIQKSRALRNFTRSCFQLFGEAYPTILLELAVMLGWEDCHNITVEKLIKSERQKYHKGL